MRNRSARVTRAVAARSAGSAAILWTATELALRGPFTDLLVEGYRATRTALAPSDRLAVSAFLIAPIMGALGAVILYRARRDGLTWPALGYHRDRRRVSAGLLGGIAVLMVSALAGLSDSSLFDRPDIEDQFMTRVGSAGVLALLALLLGNGVLVPVVEEFAWRGYVQTRLAGAWSPAAAVVATAVLFALKHVTVDGSVVRVTTLLTGALTLGLIGHRYGTMASTVAHVILNFTGTAAVIAAARLR